MFRTLSSKDIRIEVIILGYVGAKISNASLRYLSIVNAQ